MNQARFVTVAIDREVVERLRAEWPELALSRLASRLLREELEKKLEEKSRRAAA